MKPDEIIGIALRDIREGGTIEIPLTLTPSGVVIDEIGNDIWLSPNGEEWVRQLVEKRIRKE